jgi:transposase
MQENDARRLDHHTLEALRERAVRKVQEGESPEVVARVLGLNRSTVYGWLAQYRRGGWGLEGEAFVRASAETGWAVSEVDL